MTRFALALDDGSSPLGNDGRGYVLRVEQDGLDAARFRAIVAAAREERRAGRGGAARDRYTPRGQWHTFWNAGDEPARILEVISPAGFEQFFAELAPLASSGAPDPEAFGELCARYALEMRPETLPELCSRFGLWFPGVTT